MSTQIQLKPVKTVENEPESAVRAGDVSPLPGIGALDRTDHELGRRQAFDQVVKLRLLGHVAKVRVDRTTVLHNVAIAVVVVVPVSFEVV